MLLSGLAASATGFAGKLLQYVERRGVAETNAMGLVGVVCGTWFAQNPLESWRADVTQRKVNLRLGRVAAIIVPVIGRRFGGGCGVCPLSLRIVDWRLRRGVLKGTGSERMKVLATQSSRVRLDISSGQRRAISREAIRPRRQRCLAACRSGGHRRQVRCPLQASQALHRLVTRLFYLKRLDTIRGSQLRDAKVCHSALLLCRGRH